jgi:hypothetical protein
LKRRRVGEMSVIVFSVWVMKGRPKSIKRC